MSKRITSGVSLAKNMRLYDNEVLNIFDANGKFVKRESVSNINVPIGTLTNCVYECISYEGFFYTMNDDTFKFILENTTLTYMLVPSLENEDDLPTAEIVAQDYERYVGVIYGTRKYCTEVLGLSSMSELIRNTHKFVNGYYVLCLQNELFERQIRSKVLKYGKKKTEGKYSSAKSV